MGSNLVTKELLAARDYSGIAGNVRNTLELIRQDSGREMNSEEIRERYLKLYTGAIADILDKHGYRRQVLPYYVTPITEANRVAGPAFTGQGYPSAAHDK